MADQADEIEHLLELGREVDNCERHGSAWCSCKVRQFITLLGLTRETRVRWEWPEIPEGWRACDNHTFTDGRMWRTVTAAPKDESPYVHEYEFAEATRYEVERWVTPWAGVSGSPKEGPDGR